VDLPLAAAILEEAGKFANGVLSLLNIIGDRQGCRLSDDEVRTPDGWREAYGQFSEAGWNALSCNPDHGGQGLPRVVSALVEEMWNGANVAFALCPMLTRGAIEALDSTLTACCAVRTGTATPSRTGPTRRFRFETIIF
jgi:alkylation response protein AidB-like acyl-CoA dehydrogenase